MKLMYTEFRPSVNRSTVEELAVITGPESFRDAVLAEVKVCMDNDAQAVAHKLIDWHREVYDRGINAGEKLVYTYGDGRDPVGTWELVK